MTFNLSFALISLALFFLFFILTRKNELYHNLKAILPSLFLMFLLSLSLYFLNAKIIKKYFFSEELNKFLGLILVVFILIITVKLIVFTVFDFFISHKLKIGFIKFFKDISVIILYIIGILIIFNSYLNIKITAILATSAVITVVLGFALQDILGDIFSGIALNFEDSFKIGDWISIGDIEGKVEQLRWRSVKIRNIDNVLMSVPNQIASKKQINNYKKKFALRMDIGTSYTNSPDNVIRTILDVIDNTEEILKKPKPSVFLSSFDDFAINYTIRYWLKDASKRNPVESELRRRLWYAFKRNNIQIPYPIRDVYIKKENIEEFNLDSLIKDISYNEILKNMTEDELKTLLTDYEINTYGKDEVIIKNGDTGNCLYYILKGSVSILKGNSVVNILSEDDYFGEISVLTGNKATADVAVVKEATILEIASEKFKNVIEKNEELAKKIAEIIAIRKVNLSKTTTKNEKKIQKELVSESKTIFKKIKKYFGI